MDVKRLYETLSAIALIEFTDIVEETKVVENKLRIFLVDGSYIDVWLSVKRPGIYAFHWERRTINGTIYRYDNLPDKSARRLSTYPKHFHNGSESRIVEQDFGDKPEEILRNFLNFTKRKILS